MKGPEVPPPPRCLRGLRQNAGISPPHRAPACLRRDTDIPEREQLHAGATPAEFDVQACAAWVWQHLVGERRGALGASHAVDLLEDGVREVRAAPGMCACGWVTRRLGAAGGRKPAAGAEAPNCWHVCAAQVEGPPPAWYGHREWDRRDLKDEVKVCAAGAGWALAGLVLALCPPPWRLLGSRPPARAASSGASTKPDSV